VQLVLKGPPVYLEEQETLAPLVQQVTLATPVTQVSLVAPVLPAKPVNKEMQDHKGFQV
jgi:hypothetical protein